MNASRIAPLKTEESTMDQPGEWRPDAEPPRRMSSASGGMGWVWVLLLLAAAGGIAAWRYLKRPQAVPPPAVAMAPVLPAPAAPAPTVEPSDGDTLLRQLLSQISSSPDLAAWLERG